MKSPSPHVHVCLRVQCDVSEFQNTSTACLCTRASLRGTCIHALLLILIVCLYLCVLLQSKVEVGNQCIFLYVLLLQSRHHDIYNPVIRFQIQSKKGLIPADFVNELHTLCEPKHALEVSSSTVYCQMRFNRMFWFLS